MMSDHATTIIACATPPGRGGVAVIRLSGPQSLDIATKLVKKTLSPRLATCVSFYDAQGEVIDSGLAIYFQGPASYTGEDVVELHGHGSPTVVALIIEAARHYGAELAGPGAFTQRAFLQGKMDLFQAEAVASLIDAESAMAAKAAVRSLQGVFSEAVHQLVAALTQVRVWVEASIDFSEADIDHESQRAINQQIAQLLTELKPLIVRTQQGKKLSEGLRVVLAGPTNAGKSTLYNYFTGEEDAIVTAEAGTTRDVLKQGVRLGTSGVMIELLDTAGIRDTEGMVEKIGIARSKQHIAEADRIILLLSAGTYEEGDFARFCNKSLNFSGLGDNMCVVLNQCDSHPTVRSSELEAHPMGFYISAKTGQGVEALIKALAQHCQKDLGASETAFIARARHVEALRRAEAALQSAWDNSQQGGGIEISAEYLRIAQDALGQITGEMTSDDLLGEIFGAFCIGK